MIIGPIALSLSCALRMEIPIEHSETFRMALTNPLGLQVDVFLQGVGLYRLVNSPNFSAALIRCLCTPGG